MLAAVGSCTYFTHNFFISEVNVECYVIHHQIAAWTKHPYAYAASQCNTAITQKTSSSTDMFYIYAENELRYRHTSVNVHWLFFLSKRSGSSHLQSQCCNNYIQKEFWRTEKFKSTRYKFPVFLHIHIGLFHSLKTFRQTYVYRCIYSKAPNSVKSLSQATLNYF